jgi:hypothetical protein
MGAAAAAAPAVPANVMAPAAAAKEPVAATDRTIKGSTTFQNLLDWGVAKQDIEKVLGAPMGASGMTIKDFCTAKGVEFSTVKTPLQALADAKK